MNIVSNSYFTRRAISTAVLIGTLSLLGGCQHENTSTPQPQAEVQITPPELPSVTDRTFTFTARVDHNEAAGSTFTLRQPNSDLTITGTVDNDRMIQVSIPVGTTLAAPLQVSVALNLDTFKYLSQNVETLAKVAAMKAASQQASGSATAEINAAAIAEISLQTTATFALADRDFNGMLSDDEIEHHHIANTEGEHQERMRDLMVAAEVARQSPAKLYYETTYALMVDFLKDEAAKRAFFATNASLVQAAKASLFNQTTPLNEEAEDFLRLDQTGWPLQDQSLTYQEAPWACVDDIRKVSIRNYGTRLWQTPDNQATGQETLTDLILAANHDKTCNTATWRLPTVTELSGLFDQGELNFPNTFPALAQTTQYWATDGADTLVLVSFTNGNAVVTHPAGDASAQALLHSFVPYDVWFNIAPVDTQVDLAALRAAYSQDASQWPSPNISEGVAWQELGLRPAVPFPADNPYSEAKVRLGKALFFDTRLSKDNTVSCASCHDPAKGWADGLDKAVGINGQIGTRNTPTILNTAYYDTLFLDGRSASLEEQSLHPIANPIEMGLPHDELLLKLDQIAEYPAQFETAFGDETITLERIAKAIATFERTIISKESDFDRFLKGDQDALSDQQLHGLHLYRTKARCMNCHSGPMMTNQQFENIGLAYYGRSLEDRGRYNVTYQPEDMGKFRVQMLRDIKATDPTTHLGLFKLANINASNGRVTGLLAMYNNGMTRNRSGNFPQYAAKYDKNFPVVSPLIERLAMTNEELQALNAFMSAISSEIRTDSATPEEMGIQSGSH
ncbi:cytochrome c peroxidase [Photobacterium sp. MCCC 1A19761]|uniref:cytochrome c peroxidase n=1 Tax=Photobacterium sp. MCCC 1A19761 TaxID=3115000 RepID=UPI00307FC1FF